MREQWGEWDADDSLDPEMRAIVDGYPDEDDKRLARAVLVQNQALRTIHYNTLVINAHTTEHCERIDELEDRVKFLEDMLLNDTTQGGSE